MYVVGFWEWQKNVANLKKIPPAENQLVEDIIS
jgi:hypothetical protein